MPRSFKSEIGINDYESLTEDVFIILHYNNNEITPFESFRLSNKIIMLLNSFNENIAFIGHDKEYFIKLKNLKWDKEAKNLLKKIYKIYSKFESICSDEIFNENLMKVIILLWEF
ncbi:MAG: hypothetical protein LBU40_04340 [Methanobrevibacter sp.]|jgi:hypothetical protein|nr:hypothetical protein [Methanobrevibacter sp.]